MLIGRASVWFRTGSQGGGQKVKKSVSAISDVARYVGIQRGPQDCSVLEAGAFSGNLQNCLIRTMGSRKRLWLLRSYPVSRFTLTIQVFSDVYRLWNTRRAICFLISTLSHRRILLSINSGFVWTMKGELAIILKAIFCRW